MEKVQNREYELKLMLSQDEYNRIDAGFKGSETIQVNHYFDTPEFDLYKSMIVVRLRQKKETNEITVKTCNHGNGKPGAVDMHERSIIIDEGEACMLLDGKTSIRMYLSSFSDLPKIDFSEVGLIRTKRKKIDIDEDLPPAELDKSMYEGITDYELEWELDEKDYEKAIFALKSIGISLDGRASGLSKYSRLVKCLMEGN